MHSEQAGASQTAIASKAASIAVLNTAIADQLSDLRRGVEALGSGSHEKDLIH